MAAIEKHRKGANSAKLLDRAPLPDRPAGDDAKIDLDRLVYDPEFRAKVRRMLNRRETMGEGRGPPPPRRA